MTITSDAASLASVRQLTAQVAELLDVPVDRDDVALLTTELVTNAIRVNAGEVTVNFRRLPRALRVEVHDNGGGWPVMGHPQPLDENGGRGLLIVNSLADAWGADSSPERGTTVWFETTAAHRDGRGGAGELTPDRALTG